MTVSLILLTLGVLAYGIAGARLASGARAPGGALRSSNWWLGTGLQACGFLLALLSRRQLPLLLVQAAVVAALAVTALIQHLTGVRRLTWTDAAAIAAIVTGLALLAISSEPSHAPPITTAHAVTLGGVTLALAAAALISTNPVTDGAICGSAFAVGAVAGRLLMGQPYEVWNPLRWPSESWWAAGLVGTGLGVGQIALTRGLSRGQAMPVLGTMYLASTLVPALVGWLVLAEHPRPGATVSLIAGIALAFLGCAWLIHAEQTVDRHNRTPQSNGRTTKA